MRKILQLSTVSLGALLVFGCSPTDPKIDHAGPTGTASVILVNKVPDLFDGVTYPLKAQTIEGKDAVVDWSTDFGKISPDGIYTAPGVAGSGKITAVLSSDPGVKATTNVNVNKVVVSMTPDSVTLAPGDGTIFAATVTGFGTGSADVSYSATGGSVSSSGVYLAPDEDGLYVVTATSSADPRKVATAFVTVGGSVAVGVGPATATIPNGGSVQFQAAVQGTSEKSVVWSSTGGAIAADGTFTGSTEGTYKVRATSTKNPAAYGEATVVVESVVVTVLPGMASVVVDDSIAFQASVIGAANPSVIWTCSIGTITPAGVYKGSVVGSVTIRATSLQDPTKHGEANLNVTAKPVADSKAESL